MRVGQISADRADPVDPVLQKKVNQVVELTGRSKDEVIVALHDCDNDANRAINHLLEGDDQGEWKETSSKRKKRQPAATKPVEDVSPERREKSTDGRRERDDRYDGAPSRRGRQPPRLARKIQNRDFEENERNRTDSGSRDRGGFGKDFDKNFDRGFDRGFGDGRRGRGRGGGPGRGGRGAGRGRREGRGGGPGPRYDRSTSGGPSIGTWTNESAEKENTQNNFTVSTWEDMSTEDWDTEWTGSLEESTTFIASAPVNNAFSNDTSSAFTNDTSSNIFGSVGEDYSVNDDFVQNDSMFPSNDSSEPASQVFTNSLVTIATANGNVALNDSTNTLHASALENAMNANAIGNTDPLNQNSLHHDTLQNSLPASTIGQPSQLGQRLDLSMLLKSAEAEAHAQKQQSQFISQFTKPQPTESYTNNTSANSQLPLHNSTNSPLPLHNSVPQQLPIHNSAPPPSLPAVQQATLQHATLTQLNENYGAVDPAAGLVGSSVSMSAAESLASVTAGSATITSMHSRAAQQAALTQVMNQSRPKPQKSKAPPPSKIPATAVEMPGHLPGTMNLDVQFGNWDAGFASFGTVPPEQAQPVTYSPTISSSPPPTVLSNHLPSVSSTSDHVAAAVLHASSASHHVTSPPPGLPVNTVMTTPPPATITASPGHSVLDAVCSNAIVVTSPPKQHPAFPNSQTSPKTQVQQPSYSQPIPITSPPDPIPFPTDRKQSQYSQRTTSTGMSTGASLQSKVGSGAVPAMPGFPTQPYAASYQVYNSSSTNKPASSNAVASSQPGSLAGTSHISASPAGPAQYPSSFHSAVSPGSAGSVYSNQNTAPPSLYQTQNTQSAFPGSAASVPANPSFQSPSTYHSRESIQPATVPFPPPSGNSNNQTNSSSYSAGAASSPYQSGSSQSAINQSNVSYSASASVSQSGTSPYTRDSQSNSQASISPYTRDSTIIQSQTVQQSTYTGQSSQNQQHGGYASSNSHQSSTNSSSYNSTPLPATTQSYTSHPVTTQSYTAHPVTTQSYTSSTHQNSTSSFGSTREQTPSQSYGSTSRETTSQSYGAPPRDNAPSQSYGSTNLDKTASQSYGAPSRDSNSSQSYGSAARDSTSTKSYGSTSRDNTPSQTYSTTSRDNTPSQTYGTTSRDNTPAQSYVSANHQTNSLPMTNSNLTDSLQKMTVKESSNATQFGTESSSVAATSTAVISSTLSTAAPAFSSAGSVTSVLGLTTSSNTATIAAMPAKHAVPGLPLTSKAPPNLPPGVPPLMGNYIPAGLPFTFPGLPQQTAIYSYEDLQLLQRLPVPPSTLTGMTAPREYTTGAGDGKGLPTRLDAQSPVTGPGAGQPAANQAQTAQPATQQQTHQPFINPALPPGYNYYYPGLVPGGYSAYPPAMFPVPPVTNTAHGSTGAATQFQKPAGYAGTHYGTATYDDLSTQSQDFTKTYQASPVASKVGVTSAVTSNVTADIAAAGMVSYGKTQHAPSFDKAAFATGTPPPFNLAMSASGSQAGPMGPTAAYGGPYMPVMAHQPHSQMMHHHLQQDSTGGSSQRVNTQSQGQPKPGQATKTGYNAGYWGN